MPSPHPVSRFLHPVVGRVGCTDALRCASRLNDLGATHAAAAVVAEVAVAGADGDAAAVVAGWGVGLEVGELLAAGGVRAGVFGHDAGSG